MNPTVKNRSVLSLRSIFIFNVICVTAAAAYIIFSFFDRVPFDKPIYTAVLLFLIILNIGSYAYLWRRKHSLSLSSQIMLTVWFWIVVWFWIFSAPFFLAVMNIDSLQLRWSAFTFIWEVPILGGSVIIVCYYLFRPLQRFLDKKKEDFSEEEAAKLYRLSIRYPLYVGWILFWACVFGYFIGALQEYFFAAMSNTEMIKNILAGFVTFTFVSLICYVSTEYLIEPVRTRLAELTDEKDRQRTRLSVRMIFIFGLIVAGALLMMQLAVINSLQAIIRGGLVQNMEQDVARNSWESSAIKNFAQFSQVNRSNVTQNDFSEESRSYLMSHSSGVIHDLSNEPKLIGFFTDRKTQSKSVAVLYLDSFYAQVWSTLPATLFGALFVLFAGVGLVMVATRALTRSVKVLIEGIHALQDDPGAAIPRLGSNDEIEELSVALSYFVRQSQRADQAKNEFIAVASHQLRTPLAAMKWTLELLTQDAKEGMQKEILERGTSAVRNMENIAEGLLLSVRVMNGLSDNHLKEVPFSSLLDQAIKLVTPLAEKKNIDFTTSVSENLPAIMMDEEHMLWANQNLLDNAIKYTLSGGKVSLSAIQEGAYIKVSVTDSGIGISPEDQAHMFEKFFRAQKAVETSPDGSGLGLSIVKAIIEAHGGHIEFVSKLGEGTTFTYTLPINASISKYDKIKLS